MQSNRKLITNLLNSIHPYHSKQKLFIFLLNIVSETWFYIPQSLQFSKRKILRSSAFIGFHSHHVHSNIVTRLPHLSLVICSIIPTPPLTLNSRKMYCVWLRSLCSNPCRCSTSCVSFNIWIKGINLSHWILNAEVLPSYSPLCLIHL